MTDTLHTIGKLLTGNEPRDAVHIAVIPFQATDRLVPGQHIKVGTEFVGIVDPFLQEDIPVGSHCWLFMYPNTVTQLKHNWDHPAFKVAERSVSEKWMRSWAITNVADDCYGEGKKDEQDAYNFAIQIGHTMNIGPYENARDSMSDTWWDHWEAITDKSGDREGYVRCAC